MIWFYRLGLFHPQVRWMVNAILRSLIYKINIFNKQEKAL